MTISAEAEAAIAKIVALQTQLQASSDLQERIRTFMKGDLDPETKLFGIALLFQLEDARKSGHKGITITANEGVTYECTLKLGELLTCAISPEAS